MLRLLVSTSSEYRSIYLYIMLGYRRRCDDVCVERSVRCLDHADGCVY